MSCTYQTVDFSVLTKIDTVAIAPGVTVVMPHSFPFVFGEFGFFPLVYKELGPKRIDRSI
jgi:hypothetical protein